MTAPGADPGLRPGRHPHHVGLGAAAAALAAQWALHTASPGVPFAPFSVGEWLIRHVPAGIATSAIDALGHNALRVLALSTVLAALALGAAIGARHPIGFVGVALVTSLASASLDPRHPSPRDAVAAAAVAALAALLATHAFTVGAPRSAGSGTGPAWDRRRVLAALGAVAGELALGGSALRRSLRHIPPTQVRADRRARRPSDPTFDAVPGLTPAISTRADHYVVDIDLDDPALLESSWRQVVDGLVARPLSLSLDDLRAMPTIERIITLSCISNPVGGSLVGNARWTGVTTASLLELARPDRNAAWAVVEAADGYRESFPIDTLRAEGPMIAFGMDGLTLPRRHGFPARLLVPGHYGMKNVKWLTRLTLTDAPQRGYWVQRGWDSDAIVHTESRIDTPNDHATVTSPVAIAGLAWAGTRGIERVDVSIDDGATWKRTDLEPELDPLGWRRWKTVLPLEAGTHPITVRATDGTGTAQDERRQPPHPAGATGRHRIIVTVE